MVEIGKYDLSLHGMTKYAGRQHTMTDSLRTLLRTLADRYETPEFLNGDPSWFMHQVEGSENRETTAFLASVLSYGRRELFFPKIQFMLDRSHGDVFQWVRNGRYEDDIPDDAGCYYRLYNNHMMRCLLDALRELIAGYGSLGAFVRRNVKDKTALSALSALSSFFQERGIKGMVPSPVTSVAKRPCMFLRWMVRDSSPVDIGLWSSFIDKRTLFIPMDTHVVQEAQRLGLISGKSVSWHTVERLTEALRDIFPDDPARGDYALFGYGIHVGNLV